MCKLFNLSPGWGGGGGKGGILNFLDSDPVINWSDPIENFC